jgi:hypothetical protein
MSDAKHTPGPWQLFEDYDAIGGFRQRVYSVHGDIRPGHQFRGIARVPASEGDEMLEANARLIAAAPDLLEALKELRLICSDIPAIERNPRFAEASRKALAAISRAEGR